MAVWFSFDDCGDFNTHDTEEEAKQYCEHALETCRDNACEGWSQDVCCICYGEIKGQVVEVERRPWDPENDGPGCCDEWVDYRLKATGGDAQ